MAVVAITAGKRICMTNGTLVMTVYVNEFNYMTAKKTLVHLSLKIRLKISDNQPMTCCLHHRASKHHYKKQNLIYP